MFLKFFFSGIELSRGHDHVEEHLRVGRSEYRLLLWRHLLHLVLQVYKVHTGQGKGLRLVLGSNSYWLGLLLLSTSDYCDGKWGLAQEVIMDRFQKSHY